MTDETQQLSNDEVPTSDGAAIDMTALEATLEYIRPALQADGGDLILLGVDGGTVNLQMVGACGGCPLSTMTLKAGIERILTDRVPGVEVVNAS
jgi:Fe-S cluster biogenesis protein NfuA